MTVRSQVLSSKVKLTEARAQDAEASALQGILSKAAARGMAMSGHVVEARHGRRVETLRALLAERLRLERETPLGSEDLTCWHDELVQDIESIVGRVGDRVVTQLRDDWDRHGGGAPAGVEEATRHELEAVKQEYLTEAEILRGERNLPGARRSPVGQVTINISRSQVAALNLGEIIGGVQASISGLNLAGQRSIADTLKTLTEAVANTEELTPETKRDAIELTGALGEEIAGQKRQSVLRTIGSGIVRLVSGVAIAREAYEGLKTAARAAGFELP